MTLTQLRYALAVRDHGSMSAAAQACHVSQPSLSEGIKQLEQQLGLPLFERSARGTRPTQAGEALLEQAGRVLSEADTLADMAEAHAKDTLEGRFRIGVIATVSPYLLPRILQPIERAYPRLEIEIREGLTDQLLADVRSHDLDAAIIALPWEFNDELTSIEAYREHFYVTLPPGDALAGRERVDIETIDGGDLLLLEEGHCLRQHALEVCKTPESALRQQFQGTSLETIRHFVLAGWGVSLFPALALRKDEPLLIRPTATPAFRDIVIATRNSFPRQESLQAMAEFLHAQVADEAAGAHLQEASALDR